MEVQAMIENIPVELRELRQWVLWRLEDRSGKGAKVPYQVNGRKASTTEPTHWNTFEACQAAWGSDPSRFSGIGLVFSDSDNLVGIDLDNCLDDRGEILPWACLLVETLEQFAYIEASPSGRGLKAWLRANGPSKGQRFEVPGLPGSRVEVYSSGRYFTVTGWAWPKCQRVLSDGQACLESVLEWIAEREAMASESEPGLVVQPLEVPSSSGATTAPMAQAARPEAMERARLYLLSCPPAISGCGGHPHTLATAGAVAIGFDLSEDEAFQVMAHWNETCQPPWPERDLRRKIREAIKTNKRDRGYLLNESELYLGPAAQDVNLEGLLSRAVAVEPLPEPPTPKDWAEIQETFGDASPEQMVRVKALGARVVSFRDMMIGWELRDHQQRFSHAEQLQPIELPEPPANTFIGRFSRWMADNSPRYQPNLALLSAIATMAVLAGRKVEEPGGQRCNLYLLGLAESGHGKDFPLKQPGQLLAMAGNPDLVCDAEVSSDAALLTVLRQSPNTLWACDEFGKFFARLKKSKEGYQGAILDQLLKLFTSESDVCFRGKSYADERMNYSLNCPHLTLFGVTTPGPVLGALSGEDVSTGLLGRLLIVPGHGLSSHRERDRPSIPWQWIEFAKTWTAYSPGGQFAAAMGSAVQTIPMDEEARQLFEAYSRQCDKSMQSDGSAAAGLWARAYQKAKRLALICACSRLTPEGAPVLKELLRITGEDALWAIGFVSKITDWMVHLCEAHVANSQREAELKEVIRIVREAGSKGIERSQLTRKTQHLSRSIRKELIEDLIQSGQVSVGQRDTGRLPATVYQWVG